MKGFLNNGFSPSTVIFYILFTFTAMACAGTYSGGSGTAEDPYKISTVADWQELITSSTDWGKYFKLIADLDMSAFTGTQYNMVGNSAIPFTGTFDGNLHVLSNLTIKRPSEGNVGLFGKIGPFGQVLNLGLENIDITGFYDVGGLVGTNDQGTITACYVTGTIRGDSDVGGLVGWNFEGTISACYVTGRVIVDLREGYAAGGLVGESWRGTITACYATGRVDGCVEVGGLVGFNEDSMITACYATGAVNGECWSVGGLVGENYFGTITTCYATGTVNASEYVGGLVGSNGNGTIKDCFWDMETSGQTTSAGGEGKTTAEMKTQSTFTDVGWDFVYSDGNPPVWKMGPDGYPALFWEFRYSGGNGTAEDPYKISTVTDWQELIATSADWDKSFVLLNDIDFAGANLTPVAPDTDTGEWNWFQGMPFSGTLEGNGYVFHNGVINLPEKDYVGLFGYVVSPGRISNFGIENFSVVGRNNTGGLCGANGQGSTPGGEIADCYVIASVEGGNAQDYLGGLCGTNRGTISGCYSTGTVTVGERSYQIGGLCGWNDGGIIRSCYSIGTIIGGSHSYYVGGLCGWTRDGMIQTSYASVVISGWYSGGLCNVNENTPIMACFWNRDLAEFVKSDGGRALTTEQMKTLSIFQNAGWSGNGWVMADGQDFPRLAWENTGAPPIPVPGPVPLAGKGTESDPYQIHTAEEFAMLNWHGSVLDKHIQLMDDLDFTGIDLYPIGDQWNPFSGVLYGNGHILRNMVFNEPGINYIGLFGCLNASAIVQNLGVENMTLTGRYHVGGLCGENRGIVRDCSANGLIAETQLSVIGGLCGENSGTLSRCYVSGSLLGRHRVGGLCGKNAGLINDCQATGAIQGNSYTGGLCGQNTGILSGCNASCEVEGWWEDTYLGGLCGMNGGEEQPGGIIVDCYSAGSIACDGGAYFIGGLCGSNPGIIMDCFTISSIRCWMHNYFVGGLTGGNGGTIRRCYAAGSVRGSGDSNDFGGLSGGNGGTIKGCYASGSVTVGDFSEGTGGLIGANSGMISTTPL
ncbi:MAG: hypothetical protein GX455_01145 [Phycisphaerae bacterium]|nr:hypothetical protein [Phycisphaerae bacterium]